MTGPERIVCLTEETVETLYLLGQEHRIVGVTGYAVRPPRVRREKPRVGAFTSADLPKILALNPDLVLTFSDLQADIAADLIRAGIAVHAFNQRSVAGILRMIETLGALTGVPDRAAALVTDLEGRLEAAQNAVPKGAARPAVYLEEWDGHRLGLGTCRDRRRARRLRRPRGASRRPVADPRSGLHHRCRAGGDHRLVVRQEGAPRAHRRPPGVGQDPRRAKRPDP